MILFEPKYNKIKEKIKEAENIVNFILDKKIRFNQPQKEINYLQFYSFLIWFNTNRYSYQYILSCFILNLLVNYNIDPIDFIKQKKLDVIYINQRKELYEKGIILHLVGINYTTKRYKTDKIILTSVKDENLLKEENVLILRWKKNAGFVLSKKIIMTVKEKWIFFIDLFGFPYFVYRWNIISIKDLLFYNKREKIKEFIIK